MPVMNTVQANGGKETSSSRNCDGVNTSITVHLNYHQMEKNPKLTMGWVCVYVETDKTYLQEQAFNSQTSDTLQGTVS